MRFLSPLAAIAFFSLACASAPWEGMSQTDIEGWKGLGYDAAQSQTLSKHGIDVAEASRWKDAGISGWESISQWRSHGMTPEVAGDWQSRGFDARTASQWSKKEFQPAEAEEWKKADKSLGQAVDARAEGLVPIHAVSAEGKAAAEDAVDSATDAASDKATDLLNSGAK